MTSREERKPLWVKDGRGDYWYLQPDGSYAMRGSQNSSSLASVSEHYGIILGGRDD